MSRLRNLLFGGRVWRYPFPSVGTLKASLMLNRPKSSFRCALFWGFLLVLAHAPQVTWAESEDPGLIRALWTDSAPLENSYYFLTWIDNEDPFLREVYFYGQGQAALAQEWGIVLDFPTLTTGKPLGPIGLFVRYEAAHFGGWNDETAGAFSLQAGGSYGFPDKSFPSIGSSWAVKALGGYRFGRVFLQGDCGYQGGIDPHVRSRVQANFGLGYHFTTEWFFQVESDFSAITSPASGTTWSIVPQVAFQPGDWLLEFGEAMGTSPSGFSELMIARVF